MERKTSSAKNTELEWTFRNLPPGVVLTRGIQTALHGDPTASKRTGEEGLQPGGGTSARLCAIRRQYRTAARRGMARLEFRDVTIVYHHHYVYEAPRCQSIPSLARSQNIYRIVHIKVFFDEKPAAMWHNVP